MIHCADDSQPFDRLVGTTRTTNVPHRLRFNLDRGEILDTDPCTFTPAGWGGLMDALANGEPIAYTYDGILRVVSGRHVIGIAFVPED